MKRHIGKTSFMFHDLQHLTCILLPQRGLVNCRNVNNFAGGNVTSFHSDI